MLEGAGQEEWAIVGLTTESLARVAAYKHKDHSNDIHDNKRYNVMYTNMTEHYNKYRANANGHSNRLPPDPFGQTVIHQLV